MKGGIKQIYAEHGVPLNKKQAGQSRPVISANLSRRQLADVDRDSLAGNTDFLVEDHGSCGIERIRRCDTFYLTRAGVVIAAAIDLEGLVAQVQ